MNNKMQLFENQPVRAEAEQELIEENPNQLSREEVFGAVRDGFLTDELNGVLEEESGNARLEELEKKYKHGKSD